MLFFWDYDTQWGAPGRGALEFACTERLLELHAEYGVPACFAVVGAAAMAGDRPFHDPAQIRRIHDAGHEVASHAQHHEWLPGLSPVALRRTLRESREALEDCIGHPVRSFVPPYNQPFDFAARGAVSLRERRAAPRVRTDIPALCEALAETGYHACRIKYRTPRDRLEAWFGRAPAVRAGVVAVSGVACVRLHAPCGFAADTRAALDDVADRGGLLVVYGHPHSLRSGNTQDERHLVPFLAQTRALADAGRLEILCPRDIVAKEGACASAS